MTTQTSTETAWPDGVIARYLTVGGATVDLTVRLTLHNPPEPFATLGACSGCPESKEVSHWRLYTGFFTEGRSEEHDPEGAQEQAREWAQAHAEKCRAMPKPTA